MKTLPLTQGKVALVDDADFEWLNQWKWQALRRKMKYRENWYAVRSKYAGRSTTRYGKKYLCIFMHRVILGIEGLGKKVQADHKNHDGLDNQRHNLRIATQKQNSANLRKIPGTTSQYKGVHWCKTYRKWVAHINENGKCRTLGRFDSETDAALCYKQNAVRLHGEFAYQQEIVVPMELPLFG